MIKKSSFGRRLRIWYYKLRRRKINQRLMIYLVMVLISAVFWFVNKTGSTISGIMDFPVEYYGLPKNHYLLPGITTGVLQLTVSARGAYFLGHSGLPSSIKIDLSKLDIRTFPDTDSSLKFVTKEDIRAYVEAQLPGDYKCSAIKPDTLKLDFGRSAEKKVPVILDSEIGFSPQYRFLKNPVLQPDSVEVTASVNIMDSITCIKTEKIEIQNLKESFTQKAKLIIPKDVFCNLQYTDVDFFVEKFTENTIEIPIRRIHVPDSVQLRVFPQKITLKYNIGWTNYNSVSEEMFVAVVDYQELYGISKPKFLTVKILKYPENFGVTDMEIIPEAVEYLVERVEQKDRQK